MTFETHRPVQGVALPVMHRGNRQTSQPGISTINHVDENFVDAFIAESL